MAYKRRMRAGRGGLVTAICRAAHVHGVRGPASSPRGLICAARTFEGDSIPNPAGIGDVLAGANGVKRCMHASDAPSLSSCERLSKVAHGNLTIRESPRTLRLWKP